METSEKESMRLRRFDMVKMFLRSFMIQATWNYKGMLNLGFLFTIMPGLSRLYQDPRRRLEAARRHVGFFNTHPYLASYAVGAVLSAEEEVVEKGEESFDSVIRLKRSLCGPLGALGDNLFWNRWRPMCALIGILGAYLWGLWGPILFLVLYNIPHLFVRYRGLWASYRDRISFISELSGPAFRTVPALGERMGAFFTGCLVVIFIGHNGEFDAIVRSIFLAGLLVTFVLSRRYKRFGVIHGTLVILVLAISWSGVVNWLR